MNSSAHLQVFLDAPPTRSADEKFASSKTQTGNKQAFEQHLKTNIDQPAKRTETSKRPVEKSENAEQRLDVRRAQRDDSTKPNAVDNGKELPASGEKLPLPEETQEFLASLTASQRSELAEELQTWLQGLSDEQLVELENLLSKGDLAGLHELLSDELGDLLADLAQELGLQLEDLQQQVQQVLASIQQAGLDFRQLAALRLDVQAAELRLVSDSAVPSRGSEQHNRNRDTVVTTKESLEIRPERPETLSEKQGDRLEKNTNRLESLVGRLSRGDLSALNQRSGGEAMQQLIQAAGLGLGNTTAAQPAAARMAASMPTAASMMSQAAAQANAEALANRISVMQTRGMQVAEMRLDPPDLGQLRVQIRMQGDQASVIFQSPNAHARDLLENALPRLKEMLEEQGMNLSDASVSDESNGEGDEAGQEGNAQEGGANLVAAGEPGEAEILADFEQPLSLIDYYA